MMRAALVSVAVLVVASVSIARRMAARRTERCGDFRRAAAMAQGHADLERPAGQRNGQQSQPVHRLPDDRDLHARVRLAALRSPRLLRRRRRRGEHLRVVRQQVAGAPVAGQDRAGGTGGRPSSPDQASPSLRRATGQAVPPVDGATGSFEVAASNKTAPDFRAKGRLQYVGKHYLRFAGSGEYFLKAGPDSPETLLAYEDFDNTAHAQDGDPRLRAARPGLEERRPHVGQDQGQSADRRHQLPVVEGHERDVLDALQRRGRRRQRLALRRSRRQVPLRRVQAGSVADRVRSRPGQGHLPALQAPGAGERRRHCGGGGGGRRWTRRGRGRSGPWGGAGRWCAGCATRTARQQRRRRLRPLRVRAPEGRGSGGRGAGPAAPCPVPASLDCGDTGRERRLYLRELVARFGYELALNWNMGEENTQTTAQQRAMAQYIHDVDPYDHIVVVHTFPNQQEDVYQPHLGQTLLQGLSLQNSWNAAHQQTTRWVRGSAAAGVPWVVANDEQGSASTGVPPDPGLPGIHRQGQSGEHGPVAPRHPEADAVGQPDGRRRRRRVLLRLRPARQRPDARELPQPRQIVGLRADRAGVLPRREDSVLGHDQRGPAGRQPDERQQRLLLREGRRGLSGLPAQRRIGRAGSRAASPASSTSAGSTRAAAAP